MVMREQKDFLFGRQQNKKLDLRRKNLCDKSRYLNWVLSQVDIA